MRPANLLAAIAACIGIVAAVDEAAAQSDPVAAFYKGKTINAYTGVGVGGEYDLQARLIAKHLGRHVPGQPNVVPQNMTGASGLKMLNFLYNQAPRDLHRDRHDPEWLSGRAGDRQARHPIRQQPAAVARHDRTGG
jgi:tripartite-type tricarboxylate transporter receptor subunit TctC